MTPLKLRRYILRSHALRRGAQPSEVGNLFPKLFVLLIKKVSTNRFQKFGSLFTLLWLKIDCISVYGHRAVQTSLL